MIICSCFDKVNVYFGCFSYSISSDTNAYGAQLVQAASANEWDALKNLAKDNVGVVLSDEHARALFVFLRANEGKAEARGALFHHHLPL